MSDERIGKLIDVCVETIVAHADELTELDRAIGDGDHGLNMRRGFEALREQRDELAAMAFDDMLHKAGMTLVMKVGGASGPLYGSALMAMAKASGAPADLLAAGIEAIKSRGKSDVGAKTLLDVLVPVQQALAGGDLARLRGVADEALNATRDMQATKGRASFLGERSIGHIDPGARSATALVHAVCDVYGVPQ